MTDINKCSKIEIMNTETPIEEHLARVSQLTAHLRRKIIPVRDAMAIWGMRSSSAASYELQKLVELGLVEYEPSGESKGRYYLP